MISQGDDLEVLRFHEQADGRKVARLAGGKVVLITREALPLVSHGEHWLVRLDHRDTFAIAYPIERRPDPTLAANENGATAETAEPGEPAAVPETAGLATGAPPHAAAPIDVAGAAEDPAGGHGAEAAEPGEDDGAVASPTSVTLPPSAVVRPEDRVALFIDAANTDIAMRTAGYRLDYVTARTFFQGRGTVYGAFYYTADYSASADSDPAQEDPFRKFLAALTHNGFVIRKKPVKRIFDPETRDVSYKCNVDLEVAVDMLNTSPNWDVAFLFSGDSDYERVVDILRSRGKRIYLVTGRRVLSTELAQVADKPLFLLESFRAELRHRG